jgi:hypothetical protein
MLAAHLGGCGACGGAAAPRCGDATRATRGFWSGAPPHAHAPPTQQQQQHAPCSRFAAAPPPAQQHAARRRRGAPLAALPEAAALAASAAAAAAAVAATPAAGAYEPPPVEAWQLWVGFLGGVSPFIIAGARACARFSPTAVATTHERARAAPVKRPPQNTLPALTPPRACTLARHATPRHARPQLTSSASASSFSAVARCAAAAA